MDFISPACWFIKGYSCVVGSFDSKQKLEEDKKRLIKVKLLIYFLAYCISFKNHFSTLVFFPYDVFYFYWLLRQYKIRTTEKPISKWLIIT